MAAKDLQALVCTCGHTAHWHGALDHGEPRETMGDGPCDNCDCAGFVLDYEDTIPSLRWRILDLERELKEARGR